MSDMSSTTIPGAADALPPMREAAPRSAASGAKRGLRRRCPNCGQGALFAGYLTVDPTCKACGHNNAQYRADDGPAYFTILLVGHLVVAPLFALSVISSWSPLVLLAVGLPVTAAATLAGLPFIKGAWIGVLWGVTKTDAPAVEGGPSS